MKELWDSQERPPSGRAARPRQRAVIIKAEGTARAKAPNPF